MQDVDKKAGKKSEGFSEEEKAAMKQRAKEAREEARRGKLADMESDLIAAISQMPEEERPVAERIHAIIKANAPSLLPKTWYGMPAYANGDGKVVCFFRSKGKFGERYMTLGFNPEANLDDGAMWPVAYALIELTPEGEEEIAALMRKAVS